MSRKTPPRRPGSRKAERYIQASILLALKSSPSYGYELIRGISRFGFLEGPAPPGMIYRHLRELEENGLVSSEWETEGAGPAKRVYRLSAEGAAVLEYWVEYMSTQADRMVKFVETYRRMTRGKRTPAA